MFLVFYIRKLIFLTSMQHAQQRVGEKLVGRSDARALMIHQQRRAPAVPVPSNTTSRQTSATYVGTETSRQTSGTSLTVPAG